MRPGGPWEARAGQAWPWPPQQAGSQRQPRLKDSSPGGQAGLGSNRGGIRSLLPTPHSRLRAPSPHTASRHSILRLPTCFTIVYWRVFFKWIFFFYLSDYILKGNLTAPLEMENKH